MVNALEASLYFIKHYSHFLDQNNLYWRAYSLFLLKAIFLTIFSKKLLYLFMEMRLDSVFPTPNTHYTNESNTKK